MASTSAEIVDYLPRPVRPPALSRNKVRRGGECQSRASPYDLPTRRRRNFTCILAAVIFVFGDGFCCTDHIVGRGRIPHCVLQSVYELHAPDGRPELDIVFVHGLQIRTYENAYRRTWESGSVCWPEAWIPEDFPGARVFSISYDSRVLGGSVDLVDVGKNLLEDITSAKIGAKCPVIMVGHSLGGIVINQLCLEADTNLKSHPLHHKYRSMRKFMKHLWGIFYYSVPHGGSQVADWAKDVRVSMEKLRAILDSFVPEGGLQLADWAKDVRDSMETLRAILDSFVHERGSQLADWAKDVRVSLETLRAIFGRFVLHGGSQLGDWAKDVRVSLEKLRVIFDRFVPHGGSQVVDWAKGVRISMERLRANFDCFVPEGGSQLASGLKFGPMLDYLTISSPQREKINKEFIKMRKSHKWKIHTVAESRCTKKGPVCAFVVTEESANLETVDKFVLLDEDHLSICKPESRRSLNYGHLREFLQSCLDDSSGKFHMRKFLQSL